MSQGGYIVCDLGICVHVERPANMNGGGQAAKDPTSYVFKWNWTNNGPITHFHDQYLLEACPVGNDSAFPELHVTFFMQRVGSW